MSMARRPLVMGNWKMNLDRESGRALAAGISAAATRHGDRVDVALLPSFPHLPVVAETIRETPVALGAQDLHWERSGAFTGAVSGEMLRDVGVRYVLVGHSERRTLFGDDDSTVARKLQAARDAGLVPVLCVGEPLEARDEGRALEVVEGQLEAALGAAGASPEDTVIAYEPVWAIGTGRVATAAQAAEVHAAIRGRVDSGIRVLYGGSASPDSAPELLAEEDIDGLLVGSASLDAGSFGKIIEQAAASSA